MNTNTLRILSPSSTLVLALAAGLAGCATQNVNTVERAQSEARPNYVQDRRVVTDGSLGANVHVIDVRQATVSGNLLQVQATLENMTSHPLTVNYIFEWTDVNGMAVSSPTVTWRTVRLQGREQQHVSSVAVTPKAVDFTLKLQEPKS